MAQQQLPHRRLRVAKRRPRRRPGSIADSVMAMTIPMVFDFMGVQLNGPKADGKTIVLNWNFTNVGEKYILSLENSTLTYAPNKQAANADATLTLARATLDASNLGKTTFDKEIAAGKRQDRRRWEEDRVALQSVRHIYRGLQHRHSLS